MTQPKLASQNARGMRTYKWPPQEPHEFEVASVTSLISKGFPKPALAYWRGSTVAECAVTEHDIVATMLGKGKSHGEIVDYLKRAPDRAMQRKANIGTLVHSAIEAYVDGKPFTEEQFRDACEEARIEPPGQKTARGLYTGALEFLFDHEPEVLHSEGTVFSRTHGYAGTPDLICKMRVGGSIRPVIADFKTGKAVYPDMAIQLAAYSRGDFIGLNDGTEQPLADEPIRDGVIVRLMPSGRFEAVAFTLNDAVFDAFLSVKGVAQGMAALEQSRRPGF